MATQLLVLDDNVLRGMMTDIRFTSAIPCLAQGQRALASLPAGKCSRCKKRKARQTTAATLIQVRNCIAKLPAAQRAQLKQLAGARQMRVLRQNPTGGSVRVTF